MYTLIDFLPPVHKNFNKCYKSIPPAIPSKHWIFQTVPWNGSRNRMGIDYMVGTISRVLLAFFGIQLQVRSGLQPIVWQAAPATVLVLSLFMGCERLYFQIGPSQRA